MQQVRHTPTFRHIISEIDNSANFMFDSHCALFQNLTASELNTLGQYAKLKVLAKQQYLCSQQSESSYVFNIATGSAVIEKIACDGRRQVLAFLFPGDYVGLSNSGHFEYGVKSLSHLTAHQFKYQTLAKLATEIPTLDSNLKVISNRVMTRVMEQLYLLSQKKAHERLCFLFLHLLERMPNANPNHLELPMARQDIADYLGLTVATVSRSMTKLKQEGLIQIHSPTLISILDIDTIQEMADTE